jgi:hypothetical protein
VKNRPEKKSFPLPVPLALVLLVAGAASPVAAQIMAPGAQEPDEGDPVGKAAAAPATNSFRSGDLGARARTLSQPRDPGQEASNRQIEGAAQELVPPGGLYGVSGSRETGNDAEADRGGSAPEFHVVRKGDTLWSVCEQYFRDPWRWPRLWARNPLITNPHWIFPGDVVRLHEPGAVVAPPVAASSGPGTGTMGQSMRRTGSLDSKALVLREVGYLAAKELETSAIITGSREEKIMLSTGDQAYLSYPKEHPLKAGERYTIFAADKEHPVRVPDSKEALGYLVKIYGDVVIDQIAEGNIARGTLVDMTDSVERGYQVSPLVKQFKRIEPRPSAVNLETRIVAAFTPVHMLSAETFVILSRGKKDGVEVGNRTFVVRRQDGYRRIREGWDSYDKQYPNEVVGELWVVDVRDDSALAWIARTTKELRIGEIAEMRKGH